MKIGICNQFVAIAPKFAIKKVKKAKNLLDKKNFYYKYTYCQLICSTTLALQFSGVKKQKHSDISNQPDTPAAPVIVATTPIFAIKKAKITKNVLDKKSPFASTLLVQLPLCYLNFYERKTKTSMCNQPDISTAAIFLFIIEKQNG